MAANSSAFSTSCYDHWFDHKWGKIRPRQKWLKAHIICGIKTNVVAGSKVTDGSANDSPILPELLEVAQKAGFQPTEVSADKAYLSEKNLKATTLASAMPYIPFKSNNTGNGSGLWRAFYAKFMLQEEAWNVSYHKRSNVETTFSMIKGKFVHALRSKSDTGQVNEVLLKVLCHNICTRIEKTSSMKTCRALGKCAKIRQRCSMLLLPRCDIKEKTPVVGHRGPCAGIAQ